MQTFDSKDLVNPSPAGTPLNVTGLKTFDPSTMADPNADGAQQTGALSRFGTDVYKAVSNPYDLMARSAQAVMAKQLSGFNEAAANELLRKPTDEELYQLPENARPYYENLEKMAEKRAAGHLEASQRLNEVSEEISAKVDAEYKPQSWLGNVFKGAVSSSPSMLAGFALSSVIGPAAGARVGMAIGAGSSASGAYKERREAGGSHDESLLSGARQGILEWVGERFALDSFVDMFKLAKAGQAVTPAVVKNVVKESTQEGFTAVAQGIEKAFAGQRIDPEKYKGIFDYVASGQVFEDAAAGAIGGALMSGLSAPAIKAIQMSYKPHATEAVKQMDAAVKVAEASGLSTVSLDGVDVPLEDARKRMEDIKGAYSIKDEELAVGGIEIQAEAKAKLDSAVTSLKETLERERAANAPAVPAVEPSAQIESPDVSIEIDGVTTYPETQVEEAPQVSAFQNFLNAPGFGVYTSRGVDQRLGKITEDIHRDIGMQSKISLFDTTDIDKPENVDVKNYLEQNAHTVEDLGNGRIFITHEGDKRTYTIVGRFGEMSEEMQLSTLFHEGMGHAIDYEFYHKASKDMQLAMFNNFLRWMKDTQPAGFISPDLFGQMSSPEAFMQAVATAKPGEADKVKLARLFREYKAHQISSAMQKRPEVRSVLERHWAKVAEALSKLWVKFKENYLDISTGVESFDQFVDWLYASRAPAAIETSTSVETPTQAVEQQAKESVENFNIKDVSSNPLVQAVFNSMFEIVDGKRRIKDSWRFQRLYKKAGIWGKITVGDIKQTGFNYKELDGKTVVRKGETVILTIPVDASRNLSRDAVRMIATNIRDLFIVASMKSPSGLKAKQAAKQTLETASGKKVANTVGGRRIAQMWERAFEVSEQNGITPKQAFLEIFAGQHSAFSKFTPGVVGTPVMTENQIGRTLGPLQEDIKRFQTEYPGLFEQLYGAIQEVRDDTGIGVPEVLIEEHPVVEEPPVKESLSSVVDSKVRGIAEDWWNRKRPSERVQTFEGITEKVIFHFDLNRKDYKEVSFDVRNLIAASIKDFVEEKTGEAIQVSIKNKTVLQDQIRALRAAGADTTLEDIELARLSRSDDLIGGFTSVHNVLSEGDILGYYRDPVDGRDKAVISHEGAEWLPTPSGVLKKPGSGVVSKSWLHKSKGGKLTLDQIFNHPNLFAVYPQLRNLKVTFVNEPDSEVAGSSSWHDSEITINYARPIESVWKTLFHELQHQIQGIEDFAGGSSPEQMHLVIQERKQVYEEAQDFVTQALKMQRDLVTTNPGRVADQAQRKYQGREWDLAYGIILRMKSTGSFDAALAEFQSERDAAGDAYDKVRTETGETLYIRTSGEEEARRAMRMATATPHDARVQLGQRGRRAFSDISDRDASRLVRTNARSGDVYLNTLSMVDEFSNDELSYASYQALSDDLAFVRTKKSSKYTEIKEGPYEGILKARPAPKKKTKTRQVKPETLQKRKDELFRFLTNMDAIREHGEMKSLSMSEVMIELGFSKAEVRKSVARYNRHKSRFSQNETIYRLAEELGLINDLAGREGLASLIQVMFPNQTVQVPQEDGTLKDAVVEGSDGTLQSLTTISKDILINKLQTALLAKTGSKLDIESEQTLRQLREVFESEEKEVGSLRKLGKGLAWLQSSASDFLDSTPTGRELSFRLRRFLLTKTVMQRDYLVRLNRYAQVFDTPEKRESLYAVLTGQRGAANKDEEGFAHLIKAINRVYGREMEMLQVKVYRKNGKYEFFKYDRDMSDAYFPHMWKDEWFANPTESMIRSLLDSGDAHDRAHAKKLIQDYNKDRIRVNKFANIEMARETNLGGWITDPIEVYTRYIQQASKRLAGLKEFGADPDITLAQMAMRYFKESRDSEGLRKARDLIQRVLGTKVEDGLLKDPKAVMSMGVMYSVGLLLQHAFMVQPGVMVNMGAMAGYKNLVKGFAAVLPALWGGKTAEGLKRWAELAGVLAFTVNRELNDVIQDEESRLKTDKILRSFGITQIDGAMRIAAAIVGKMYATETALRYIEKQTPQLAVRLKRLGIRPESVLQPGYLQSQNWISQDLRLAALAFTEDTNFVLDPMRTPSIIQGHPLGRLFFLFKNFAFQQHRLMLRLLKDKEFGKFSKVIGGALVGGSLITLLKLLLQGEDPEKVLEKDGIVKMLWRALMAGGGAGIFAEAAGSALIPGSGPQTGLSLDSPVFGLIETAGRGSKSFYNVLADDYTDQDINNLYRSGIMALQAGALGGMPAKFGVPINAVIGMTRPISERAIAPSPRMQDTSYLQ